MLACAGVLACAGTAGLLQQQQQQQQKQQQPVTYMAHWLQHLSQQLPTSTVHSAQSQPPLQHPLVPWAFQETLLCTAESILNQNGA